MNILTGNLIIKNQKIAIVVARFNEFITTKLLDGAIDTLKRHNVKEDQIDIVWVPGAFEIPLATQKLATTKKYAAVICLGAVIRGSTSHYDYVCNEAAKGIGSVGLQTNTPCIFGVLTTDSIEQAIERAGTKAGNKGSEAALTALEMINLLAQI